MIGRIGKGTQIAFPFRLSFTTFCLFTALCQKWFLYLLRNGWADPFFSVLSPGSIFRVGIFFSPFLFLLMITDALVHQKKEIVRKSDSRDGIEFNSRAPTLLFGPSFCPPYPPASPSFRCLRKVISSFSTCRRVLLSRVLFLLFQGSPLMRIAVHFPAGVCISSSGFFLYTLSDPSTPPLTERGLFPLPLPGHCYAPLDLLAGCRYKFFLFGPANPYPNLVGLDSPFPQDTDPILPDPLWMPPPCSHAFP